ncbi:MAG: membrane protein [marine bacterium B5-7]|nr:MAG: membrane protein [marine bacterium B5-7]
MLEFKYLWALIILPLPLLVHWLVPAYQEQRPAMRLPFFRQFSEVTQTSTRRGPAVRRRTTIQLLVFILAWSGAVVSLARPQWLQPPVTVETPTRDLLLVVDLSGSMDADDFKTADGRMVKRLTGVKEIVDDFLIRREGDRVGLVVFGNSAFVQSPFTTDLEVVRQLLDQTAPRMAGPKTAFGDAIGLGINMFEKSDVKHRVMIALTDGNDTGSQVPPEEAARIAADRDIVIHTIAIGDPASVGEEVLDEKTLKKVAEITDGEYFFAADGESLEGVYSTLDKLETRVVETVTHRPRLELFQWPLAISLVSVLLLQLVYAVIIWLRYARSSRASPLEVIND